MGFLKKPIFGLPLWMVAGLFFASVLCQSAVFGHPFAGVDQDFYIYGGGQLLSGKTLYVDFWDRKSPGLFLLFAVFHAFGEWRFWAVPVFASLFIWVGSLYLAKSCVVACPLKQNRNIPPFVSSLVFIASFTFFKALGGQAEDYYVPLVAIAFGIVITNWDRLLEDMRHLFWIGCCTMGVMGLALFIKSSCVWEGLVLGLCLLMMIINNHHLSPKNRILLSLFFGLIWATVALLPIAAGAAWYIFHNLWHEWFFANVTSYQLKIAFPYRAIFNRFEKRCFQLTLTFICLAILFLRSHATLTPKGKSLAKLLWVWLLAAFLGVLSVKGWHRYPLCSVAAPAAIILSLCWEKRWAKILILCILIDMSYRGAANGYDLNKAYEGVTLRQQYKDIGRLLQKQPGCIASISSPYIVYDLLPRASSCQLTKYVFPYHFSDAAERPALGVDVYAEVKRVINLRPLYILYAPNMTKYAPDVARYTSTELQKNYVLVKTITSDDERYVSYLYKLKPGLAPLSLPKDAHKAP